jgi:hypothetical protein
MTHSKVSKIFFGTVSAMSGALSYKRALQKELSAGDTTWKYTIEDLPNTDDRIPTESDDHVILKLISFGADGITLSFNKQKLNRILTMGRPSKFCAMSFGPFKVETDSRKTADYIESFLLTGISNSIQVFRSVFAIFDQCLDRSRLNL